MSIDDPKVRAVLEKIQRDLSMALKPLRFNPSDDEARAQLSNFIRQELIASEILPTGEFDVELGHYDEKTGKMDVTIRGPRELLARYDIPSLKRSDDYTLRVELPDGTEWTA